MSCPARLHRPATHLVHCSLNVPRVCCRHGLQRDFVIAADLDAADLQASAIRPSQKDSDNAFCREIHATSTDKVYVEHAGREWYTLTLTVRVGRRLVCHVLSQYLCVFETSVSAVGDGRFGGAATA